MHHYQPNNTVCFRVWIILDAEFRWSHESDRWIYEQNFSWLRQEKKNQVIVKYWKKPNFRETIYIFFLAFHPVYFFFNKKTFQTYPYSQTFLIALESRVYRYVFMKMVFSDFVSHILLCSEDKFKFVLRFLLNINLDNDCFSNYEHIIKWVSVSKFPYLLNLSAAWS